MAKKAHGFPVGMFAVNGGTTSSTAAALGAQIKRIYEGEPSIAYEACNHLQSYRDGGMWDAGSSEPGVHNERNNNINGWVNYLHEVKDVCDEFGAPPGAIKALISGFICQLTQGSPNDPWPLGPRWAGLR